MPASPLLPLPSWSRVLGFGRSGPGELDNARSAQAAEYVRSRRLGLSLHVVMAAVVALPLCSNVPAALLVGWASAMVALALLAAWDLARRSRPGSDPTVLLARSVWLAAAFGLLWAVPTAVFSRWADPPQLIGLAMLAPGVMAAPAFLLAAAPLAALAFIVTATLGGMGLMLTVGAPMLMPVVAVAGIAIGLAALRHARTLMSRRGVEQLLAEKDAVVSLLLREFERGADWLWQTDAAGSLAGVGRRLARRLNRAATELEGRDLVDALTSGGVRDTSLGRLAERLAERQSFGDLQVPVRVGGELRWWAMSAVPRRDEQGHFIGFQGMASDITERRRSAEKIERMARFDSLTGLANRRHLLDTLEGAVSAAARTRGAAALMIVDLDRFKQINDTLGHPIGDRLLKMVAERLKSLCGERALPGRLGGDEFALVLHDASDAAAMDDLAERVILSLSAPYEIDGHRLFVGASIGSALSPRDGNSAEVLVRNADLGLYRAKDDGRGVHRRYEHRLSRRAEERRQIEVALRDALERNQFRLLYQPIVSAADARVEGFEAYLRWNHPELGEVPPERFVPIAEEARLMNRIGEWAIRTAVKEAANWPAPTRLALNLSAEQVGDPHLVTTVVQALSASGLAADRLELEIAEAVFTRPGTAMQPMLDRLNGLGVRVALSQFGTGYAALGYLRSARFSSIKLDRSFVAGASRDAADSLAMIRAVVAMADGLGMTVTAEGTETERDYDLVRRLGCGLAQGYLFGHPVPAAEARMQAGSLAREAA